MTRLALTLLFATPALSAEVSLRATATAEPPVVFVGDVADVTGPDSQAVRKLPIGPLTKADRRVTSDEVRRRLVSAGLWTSETTLVGSSECTVQAKVELEPAGGTPSLVSASDKRRAIKQLTSLVQDRLETAFPSRVFNVEIDIADDDVLAVLADTHGRLAGGSSDLSKPQAMALLAEKPIRFTASITETPAVVVTAASLPRGTILQASHLSLAPSDLPGLIDAAPLVGQQLQRPLPAGRPVTRRDVKPVRLVRNGAIVTVSVASPGIRVSRQMKSRDSGGLGDVIQCVSLDGTKIVAATVTGANTASVGPPSPSAASIRDETGSIVFEATETGGKR